MQWLYELKTLSVDLTGLGKDALHIHVGLFLGACLMFGWKARDGKAWLLVLAVALANEAFDLRYHYVITENWLLGPSIHDVVNTMIAPTLILVLARWSTVFIDPRGRIEPEDPSGDET